MHNFKSDQTKNSHLRMAGNLSPAKRLIPSHLRRGGHSIDHQKNPGVACARDSSKDQLGGKSHHHFSQNPGCCPVAREEPSTGSLSDVRAAGGSMKPLR